MLEIKNRMITGIKKLSWFKKYIVAIFLITLVLRIINSENLTIVLAVILTFLFPCWIYLIGNVFDLTYKLHKMSGKNKENYTKPFIMSPVLIPQQLVILLFTFLPPVTLVNPIFDLEGNHSDATTGFNVLLLFVSVTTWFFLVVEPVLSKETEQTET